MQRMSLIERLNEDMKQAMKSQDKFRLSVIRMVRSSIKNAEIERQKPLDDSEVIDILQREVKQRKDSLQDFEKAGRSDLAADAIVQSAFGFSGQKCSACSRAVVHEDVYEEVLEKAIALAKNVTVGDPSEENVYMGAVINEKQFNKIKSYIEIGKEEGKLVFGGETDGEKGFFVYPAIFKDVNPKARIMQEEIFGPVVAFAKGKDFDELLEIANNTEYGLTGAVISKNREHLERARYEFHVGNLYFNRGCTAAVVGYQPFGGFKMSGTDSKAGGPDYLKLFMEAKSVSEMF